MPKREDLKHILVIGSGPIVIGQACEFDYSGTQACRVLRAEGLRVSLVNSNPATIMTDPEFADATYVEPITPEFVEKVIAAERPDALLATLGGQTALNTAVALYENGVLDKYGVELIGANIDAIRKGEDRQLFKDVVALAGGDTPKSRVCHSMAEVREAVAELGLPVVIRPSFTMGGLGSGMAHTDEQLELIASTGLSASPTTEVLIEESVLGWKEYELELMRDKHDNVVVICSIENIDPMGVHTGDSVTVAPAMTLTDVEYQAMRDLGIAVLREVGVDTGGCNIQFAIHPGTGRIVVIEMNPRVSRSSALASKATGFPIAKIAAKLAIGYTLDEIPNDITLKTPAAFEPALDYVVVKIPRFAFEKFPGADTELTTTMKSVGEAMSLGRNFSEALNKAMRSMETKAAGFWTAEDFFGELSVPHDGRLYAVEKALRDGRSVAEVCAESGMDPWFVDQILGLVELRTEILDAPVLDAALLRKAKRAGLSDRQVAALRPEFAGEDGVRSLRHRLRIRPVYKTVDTCAAEFEAQTPYYYSTYDEETEVLPSAAPKVVILGSGPNRIGQGIEFDYSCVHAVMALREAGYETVMVNCNPETVSTDYDTADRLYFEPLTFEDVFEVYHAEHTSGLAAGGPGVIGVIVQLGGQTPLGLAQRLKNAGVPIVGTSPESIHLAEERGAFGRVLAQAGLRAPAHGTAISFEDAKKIADEVGYPVLVRPSYVLGGRGMEIVYDDETLRGYIGRATEISPEHPVLVDRFLDDAIEIDVDALCDATGEVYLGGIMEHIEEAGIHSGDSACALPPITLGSTHLAVVREYTEAIARGVGVQGLLNVQYALKDDSLYVLEANPRASRTVPFVSKATAVPLAKAAARIALGATIAQLRAEGMLMPTGDGGLLPEGAPIAVKEAVLPFKRFRTPAGRGVDTLLSPEMKSTGEVMGIDTSFGYAFAKSQSAAYGSLPTRGRIFVSVANRDKRGMIFPIKRLADLGFEIVATTGTGAVLRQHGIPCEIVGKHYEHGAKDAVSLIAEGYVQMVINTPQGSGAAARSDGYEIRNAAVSADIPCCTTVPGAAAAVMGIEALMRGDMVVRPLQKLHAALRPELYPATEAGA
jgi:carbamoyl-phosphate synthase large subunit